ncbi:LuxR C-terminal-related transcriptional regulator [Streptomyces sp. NPDC059917]|uniref:helix-turn-helix transcriptional regulator n=1 Tax=Streptomyces sp. NPDC059917 TaxID=3347002 RepID=UPI0036566079
MLDSPRTVTTPSDPTSYPATSTGTGPRAGSADRRVPVAVYASDPISLEGTVGQLRRRPEVELREESGPDTVALLVVDALDDAALTRLRRLVRGEGARAVLVVGAMREGELLDVMECGIGAIVRRRDATAERLVRAVLAASRGDSDLPADLLGRLIHQLGTLHRGAAGRPGPPALGLAPREVDVLRLVAEGFDTAEIAGKLSYSERTVKNVVHGLTIRLHLRNRAHAVAFAFREGYI